MNKRELLENERCRGRYRSGVTMPAISQLPANKCCSTLRRSLPVAIVLLTICGGAQAAPSPRHTHPKRVNKVTLRNGPTGPRGPKGEVGPVGVTGQTGAVGEAGPSGARG